MHLHASHLHLPTPKTTTISSLLFDPPTHSLALLLSNSSALLLPNFSPSSPSTTTSTSIPSSTAAAFLSLLPSNHLLFLSLSPSPSSHLTLLRAHSLNSSNSIFSPAKISFRSHHPRSHIVLDHSHGLGVRLAASVNAFVIHFLAARCVWVFGVRPLVEGEEVGFKFVKCAVIELTLPIYSIGLSTGFLVLGEVGGVRVYSLRRLVKGGGDLDSMVRDRRRIKLGNGAVGVSSEERLGCGCACRGRGKDGVGEGKIRGCCGSCKLKTLKLKQSSSDDNFSLFLVIKPDEVGGSESCGEHQTSLKVVSIHLLSQKKFLILDSSGVLHVLALYRPITSAEITQMASISSKEVDMYPLAHSMEVQILAVLPDISSKTRVVWISDGGHSVHLISVADIESQIDEIIKDSNRQKALTISAIGAIFTSDKVQDISPLSATSVLVLCEGGLFTYAIA